MAAILFLVLLVTFTTVVKSYMKKISHGCCVSAANTTVPGQLKKAGQKHPDRRKRRYPYQTVLYIEGMTGEACARRVEECLNRLDGVWTTIEPEKQEALVQMKELIPLPLLRKAVEDSGYTVSNCRHPSG